MDRMSAGYAKNLEEDVRKGLGMEPYHGPGNFFVGDLYYWNGLLNKYTKEDVDSMTVKLRGERPAPKVATPPAAIARKGTGFNKGDRVRVVVKESGIDLFGTFDRMLVFGTALVSIQNSTCQLSAPVSCVKHANPQDNLDSNYKLTNRISGETIYCETLPNKHDWDWDLWELRPPVHKWEDK